MGLLKMKNTVTQMRNGLIKRFDTAEEKCKYGEKSIEITQSETQRKKTV